MTSAKRRYARARHGGSDPRVTLAWSMPASGQDLLIRGGTVLTITNGDLPDTDVLIRDGKIAEIGPEPGGSGRRPGD